MRKLTFVLACLFLVGVRFGSSSIKIRFRKSAFGGDGQPFIGAVSSGKGTTIGTITDVEGNFRESVAGKCKNSGYFVCRYEVRLNLEATNGMTVRMQSDALVIDEVVAGNGFRY